MTKRLVAAFALAFAQICGAQTYSLIGQFGSTGSGPGEFNGPAFVAIDPSTHNVVVSDTGNSRVEIFDAAGNYVAAISEHGRMLLFQIGEMKQMAKGRGVIIMGLEKGEKVVAVAVSDQPGLVVAGLARGREKQVTIGQKDLGHYAGHRARMGRVLPDKLKPHTLKVPPKPDPAQD